MDGHAIARRNDWITYLDIHSTTVVGKIAVHVHRVEYGPLRGVDLNRAAIAHRGRIDDAQVVRLEDAASADIEQREP